VNLRAWVQESTLVIALDPRARLEDRRRVLHAIPWEPRGAFLVASWNLLRPRETRALDLDDFDASKPAIAIYKAVQGPRPDAPVGTTKNRTQSRREVWDDELLQWLAWRLEQATPEAKLRDEIALFWCPTARNAEKRWSDDPLRQEWNRACVTAKVPHIPLYQGTKHTTATALAEGWGDGTRSDIAKNKSGRTPVTFAFCGLRQRDLVVLGDISTARR
jgi:integrase